MFPFDYLSSADLPPAFKAQFADGTGALIRHVTVADAPRLKQGFRLISALARRRHFPGDDVTELGEEQLKALEKIDGKNYVIWGALNTAKPDEPGIGIARYRRIESEPDAADVAITVLDQYQGSGAGMLLHACLHCTARHNGIKSFYYDVAGQNVRFQRHLKNLGAEHVGNVHLVTRLRLPVFQRAFSVPKYNASGIKFAAQMRKLTSVTPASG